MTTTARGKTKAQRLLGALLTGYDRAMACTIRHECAAVLAVLVLAVLVRVLYMALCLGLDSPPTYDGQRYDSFALRILAGQGYRTELGLTASKPPLYPFFVAGAYWLFGPSNVVALRLLQAALDGLTCVLVYLLGKSLAGRGVGLLAAGGAAVYPLSLYMSALLYPESLFLFLFVAWLLLFVEMVRSGRIRMGVVSGILFGLCVLARPNIALLVPFAALFPFFMRKPAGAWRLALGFLAAIVVTILPWSVRNFLVFGEFVPLTTEGGGGILG